MDNITLAKPLLGDKIEITVYDIEPLIGELLLDETYVYAQELQKIFNLYDPSSELSKLNRERKIIASRELLEVIKKGLEYSELTKGKYDITLGKQTLERKSNKEISKITGSYKDIKISGNVIELTHEDILIDLGSIAKGYIVDKIIKFLKIQGIESGFVNARGDMASFGKEEKIEIQHPRDKDKTIIPFRIKDQAVATSGDYNQFNENYENSHILGKEDIISATIVADTCMEADAFATIVMVTNNEERKTILAKNPKIKAQLIDKELKTYEYNNFISLEEIKNEI
ncbi:MAG: FAD:protein FMN transferase [archaeon]